ncbi:MAG: hypothetical protein GWN01_02500, partial [Nitrosopumilaceae archaeon]|nr:hypothetical protein [Nitrosopumilaceae archaeon]NIU87182.1 hypothetical protein [Nitrosopumilaceae archaeon]NIV64965.1 hypothetical protein [Nitrosopumilaceae archaeon]NIX60441.1 hypothetical protein [Nitrosopumilaceae archaeon]
MTVSYDTKSLRKKIDGILKIEDIRFAAFIDEKGDVIQGRFHEGLVPLEDEKQRQKLYQELALRVSTRRRFDAPLGRVKYSASRREKIVMMSFPYDSVILLITAEPNVNIDRLAYKII